MIEEDSGNEITWQSWRRRASPVSKSSVFKMSSVPAADPGEGPTLNWWKWGPKGQKTYLSQGLDDRRINGNGRRGTGKIKFRFQIYPAYCGQGLRKTRVYEVEAVYLWRQDVSGFTTVLNSPSCLVFISGYANTENVFYKYKYNYDVQGKVDNISRSNKTNISRSNNCHTPVRLSPLLIPPC